MMRVYICPDCGWMRMVSRRKNVECYKCGVQDMTLAKVDFATICLMVRKGEAGVRFCLDVHTQ